jgi:hypothetical protein
LKYQRLRRTKKRHVARRRRTHFEQIPIAAIEVVDNRHTTPRNKSGDLTTADRISSPSRETRRTVKTLAYQVAAANGSYCVRYVDFA